MTIFKHTVVAFAVIATTCCIVSTACHALYDRASCRMFRTLMPLLERSEKVDSCLTVLRGIDTMSLTRPADKARWSLLYAMALDKNYIDTTDISVLQPAIDRYTRWTHLNRLDKFYTWYYKARIEENANIYDVSLDSYLHAERYMGAADNVCRCRLYFGFERVYMKTLSFKDAYESALNALSFARKTKDKNSYATALIDCTILSSDYHYFNQSESYIKEYREKIGEGYQLKKGDYFRANMIYYRDRKMCDSSMYYLEKYVNASNSVYYLQCVPTLLDCGDIEKADYMINEYEARNQKEAVQYPLYYFKSRIKELKGDYKGALLDLQKQESLVNKDYMYSINEDIPYVNDRFHHMKRLMCIIIIAISIVGLMAVGLLCLLFSIKKQRLEMALLKKSLSEIKNNKETNQTNLVWKQKKPDEISKVFNRIIDIATSISSSSKMSLAEASEWIAKRSEPGEFVAAICGLGKIHCMHFCTILMEMRLTDFELSYTILAYALSTKELMYVFKRKDLYNVNMVLKKKFGVEGRCDIRQVIKSIYWKNKEN